MHTQIETTQIIAQKRKYIKLDMNDFKCELKACREYREKPECLCMYSGIKQEKDF